jgi:hypothetical protein
VLPAIIIMVEDDQHSNYEGALPAEISTAGGPKLFKYVGTMSTIAVPIANEDLRFLRAWTAEHGTSAEAFLAQQAHHLREHIQRRLHPVVANAIGVISEGDHGVPSPP